MSDTLRNHFMANRLHTAYTALAGSADPLDALAYKILAARVERSARELRGALRGVRR